MDFAEIIITVIPGLAEWLKDTVEIVITVTPGFLVQPPFLLAAVSSFVFIFGIDHYTRQGRWKK